MSRRRRGQAIHGWLAIDKPVGITSTDVVNRLRRTMDAAKVGHGGTLDPLASGVLPIAFGEATKTVSYVMDGTKVYHMVVGWGEARDTDDREGKVIDTSDVRPDAQAITAMLARFTGEIEQVPPIYSAVKVEGRRSYDLARADQAVELKSRKILIKDLTLLETSTPDFGHFRIVSGKGAYMRSLARDLALALGTVGHVVALRRLACGPFTAETAISLDMVDALGHDAPHSESLLPIEAALADIPAVPLTEAEARRLSQGQPVSLLHLASRTPLNGLAQGETVQALLNGKLVALAKIVEGEIRPLRVVNL
ncbi:tRNA pseudouridine(55) synthase TruB [Rhodospirillum rubrum]|uniref:tRNA pseudouridine synthase B n=1 Tax=Rhodospirillum rubrum (strain ATCC 11170 / ATH 1.1.1 / DSM 467 / LMG 4362 / NCIMB 8255 / S1) TaxID=269796 RepID=TRUB_RHORT|nr:tRNA pseudouridine(55) synthase TruB [Rhodospirillum rubrum]Q2RMR8.1 RecName: Full=tRNA pseudouridine synthase B; AltName: Full=tRNA pseudouridine(55) synthase; Short=Psi55 synthase; AltName: Full=tRNA pseudouridylate synthase; AltName: Full=tRNA-uridine isomerase [Rhodospirillum rubrum ATCC 11170]ABC24577.1 tRNA pseudouridine synthase B [Rhodospirillum rubrum ATCC 11170]AEO50330.1 tRNA pseudouridine synthase B [Rhodospirillum rubrum F11]MBK5956309.1 tRNA pseudouridine(55) synthase TruB [Rho